MAFLVKRNGVYHLSHCADGKRTRFSTGLKCDVGQDVRKAREMEAEYTLREKRQAANAPKIAKEERWESWVPEFTAMKYRNNAASMGRYRSVERTLRMFWTEFGIITPRQLTRQHCFKYFEWRKVPDPKLGKFPATHNTALLEMQTLSVLMKEAVHRGYAPANPCRELGIGRDEEKKPADLSDEVLAELEARIQGEPEPNRTTLWRSYLVARYHGVRLTETKVNPLRDVVLNGENGSEITFYQKGGRKRTKPLHPKLVPMFAECQAVGATELYPVPKSFSAFWWQYLNKWNMKRHGKVCFHSLRVTVQNKLRRAGINEEIRKAYLSHESQSIHQGYSRIQIDEMRVCHHAL